MSSAKHRAWTLGPGDAESLVAEARKALFVMVGFLAILWIVQLVNFADHYHLDNNYGIRPHHLASLPYILTAPFLHVSWTHLESNSGPLFIFGFLAAYRGVVRWIGLTALVIVTSGLASWFFGGPGTGVGASGVVFGYLGYILVRGFFDRHGIDIMIGAVMALCFAYQFTVLLPHAGIGWQDHVGGLVGGIVGGWIFRNRKVTPVGQSRPRSGPGKLASAAATAGGPTATPGPAATAGPKATAGLKATASPTTQSATSMHAGPRADLHRQLDDLGL